MSSPSPVHFEILRLLSNELTRWAMTPDIHSQSLSDESRRELEAYFESVRMPIGISDSIQRGMAMILSGLQSLPGLPYQIRPNLTVVDRLDTGSNPNPDGSKAD